MSVTMKNVFSSHVAAVGYDDETKELIVEWSNGRISAYAGADEDLVDKLSRAPSVGNMLITEIKGQMPHRYIK